MPYISNASQRRAKLIEALQQLKKIVFETTDVDGLDGDLNFVITTLLLMTLQEKRYQTLERVIGLLECVKMEFYRRMVSPYEDKKIIENGDVYPKP